MRSHLATLPRTVWILGLISLALAVLGPPLAAGRRPAGAAGGGPAGTVLGERPG